MSGLSTAWKRRKKAVSSSAWQAVRALWKVSIASTGAEPAEPGHTGSLTLPCSLPPQESGAGRSRRAYSLPLFLLVLHCTPLTQHSLRIKAHSQTKTLGPRKSAVLVLQRRHTLTHWLTVQKRLTISPPDIIPRLLKHLTAPRKRARMVQKSNSSSARWWAWRGERIISSPLAALLG